MTKTKKFYYVIIYLWCIFSVVTFIAVGIMLFLGGMFAKSLNLDSEKAIREYNILYELVVDQEFVEGKMVGDEIILLTMNDGTTKELLYQADTKYIYGMYRGDDNEIILQSSGGIIGSDSEIVFTEHMLFDQKKYVSIKRLDDNLFLCELKY